LAGKVKKTQELHRLQTSNSTSRPTYLPTVAGHLARSCVTMTFLAKCNPSFQSLFLSSLRKE